MKYLFVYPFLLICCLYAACGGRTPQPARIVSDRVVSDSACSVSLVKDVLKWYALKYDSIDAIQLVNMPPSEDSGWNTVNFGEAARYLRMLRLSRFFTEKFLAAKEAYFRKCDSNFAVLKENNRSPSGFDVDPLLFSINTDEFLEDTIAPDIEISHPRMDDGNTVRTVTFDKCLLFTVKKAGDTCRIEDIQFRTDPDSAADAVLTRGADSTEPVIRKIKREYDKIRADSAKFHTAEENMMDQSTEGGESTKFYEGQVLRKIVTSFFGETGKVASDYYFVNGQLFFYFSRYVRYTKPFTIVNSRVGRVDVNRCYFENQRLVRWIDEKGKIVDKGLYPAKEKELLEEVKNMGKSPAGT